MIGVIKSKNQKKRKVNLVIKDFKGNSFIIQVRPSKAHKIACVKVGSKVKIDFTSKVVGKSFKQHQAHILNDLKVV